MSQVWTPLGPEAIAGVDFIIILSIVEVLLSWFQEFVNMQIQHNKHNGYWGVLLSKLFYYIYLYYTDWNHAYQLCVFVVWPFLLATASPSSYSLMYCWSVRLARADSALSIPASCSSWVRTVSSLISADALMKDEIEGEERGETERKEQRWEEWREWEKSDKRSYWYYYDTMKMKSMKYTFAVLTGNLLQIVSHATRAVFLPSVHNQEEYVPS